MTDLMPKSVIKRPLSGTPAAIRKRRSRQKRKNGLHSFRLYLPIARIEQAVRKRENIATNVPVTKQLMTQVLIDAFHWWSGAWIGLKRDRARHR